MPRRYGKEHPMYVGPANITCRMCGKVFQVPATQKMNRSICSKECRAKWLSISPNGIKTRFKKGDNAGKQNHKWKGGSLAKYGLCRTAYDEIFKVQHGVCAVCGKPPSKIKLSIDHDHTTGGVRGLLCFRCNFGMGWFQSDVGRLQKLIEYITNQKDYRQLFGLKKEI